VFESTAPVKPGPAGRRWRG